MGDDVAGPSSLELGYLRREPKGSGHRPPQDGPARLRSWLWVVVLVGVLAALAIAVVTLREGGGNAITCTLTCDAESDRLTAATSSGEFTLERTMTLGPRFRSRSGEGEARR